MRRNFIEQINLLIEIKRDAIKAFIKPGAYTLQLKLLYCAKNGENVKYFIIHIQLLEIVEEIEWLPKYTNSTAILRKNSNSRKGLFSRPILNAKKIIHDSS